MIVEATCRLVSSQLSGLDCMRLALTPMLGGRFTAFDACGLWPDLTTMTVEAGLKTPEAPHCGDDAGTATVSLTIVNGAFVVSSVRIDRRSTPGDRP